MRRSLFAIALVGWSGVWAACSSFEDAPSSTGADASAEDSAIGDGASNADGSPSSDASDAGAGDATFTCVGSESFLCDGFERSGSISDGWNSLGTVENALLTLSSKNPYSGAGSMQLEMFATDGSARRSTLTKVLPTMATSTTLDFWVRYDTPPSTDTTIAGISLEQTDGFILVQLTAGGGFLFTEQYKTDAGEYLNHEEVLVGVAFAKKYRHIRLDVGPSLVDGGHGARLTVDNESRDLGLVNQSRPKAILLGVTFSEGAQSKDDFVWFDDVEIEATPR